MNIGTLIRCPHIDERRIAFFNEIGLDCIQIAGVFEEHLISFLLHRWAPDVLQKHLRSGCSQVRSH